MKIIKSKNNIVIKKVWFEAPIYLLPLLLLPIINSGHYRYILLYVPLWIAYIYFILRELRYPILSFNSENLTFRPFVKSSYFKGFLTQSAISASQIIVNIEQVSKFEFQYPLISIYLNNDDIFKVKLNIKESEFNEIENSLQRFNTPDEVADSTSP